MKVYELYPTEEKYPEKLRLVKPLVKKIYACGDISLLSNKSIAVVGSRNNSEYGKKITEKITKELVYNGVTIISGMAIGIDDIAHRACIENGGKTIAVLGSGFNNIYPKENKKLFYQIINSGGLVISEYSIDTQVQMKNFPKRNRIISGLSDGVLIVEGAYRSGTSITARNAEVQGKKIFYVPNCVGNKNSYGPIRLGKAGAIMVTCGKDILDEIDVETIKQENNKLENFDYIVGQMDEETRKVFICLRALGSLNCEQISVETNIEVVRVNQILSYLELEDYITNTEINKYKVCERYCE